jgi:hypothetical protein
VTRAWRFSPSDKWDDSSPTKRCPLGLLGRLVLVVHSRPATLIAASGRWVTGETMIGSCQSESQRHLGAQQARHSLTALSARPTRVALRSARLVRASPVVAPLPDDSPRDRSALAAKRKKGKARRKAAGTRKAALARWGKRKKKA